VVNHFFTFCPHSLTFSGIRVINFPCSKRVSRTFRRKQMAFKVGDNAVYPGHGVGVVKNIETKEIFGKKQTFYTIQILDNGMKIMIPKDNVESVGLRAIISRKEANEVFKILRKKNIKIDNQT